MTQPLINRDDRRQRAPLPRAFTLIEMLVVMLILGLLVAMSLSAFNAAVEQSRVSRTKVIVAKLDQLIMEKWESYRTRPVPIRVSLSSTVNPRTAGQMRLNAIRDLMRMEMPDRKTDVVDGPCYYATSQAMASPALRRAYQRKAQAAAGSSWATTGWTEVSQGAECLYLIVSCMRDGDRNALDYFTESEIGDTDGDGMKEILDAWGRPIEFLRWAPGFTIENGALTMQTSDAANAPDPFDPLKLDSNGFALRPLIMSPGTDKSLDIFTDNTSGFHHYSASNAAPQPFTAFTDGQLPGYPMDRDGDGVSNWVDNITNHYQEAE
ncbi:hypothetical protein ETAA8_64020 [Anatilimnocola aggregata]|uniref:Prepilin-type N-terminal cleavage/methylation domain-containing protein n=1 Tax=Anatilimnocola aggregata TaxID=2528021 RepID=A0A517YM06_9BACT|nr:prepilin-type N-terminal cleavage/methylation domain-containing protein [Anatilimnocola aggregata]QDU31249.1 hypothetical protein ETAA8_64020 [Anatilimnocola aggregata]